MSCEYCTDPDGAPCFPIYGLGPHQHTTQHNGMIIGSYPLPSETWPENYREDPDCPGHGVWWCPQCGDGKPNDRQP